jgi:hypothetical protein
MVTYIYIVKLIMLLTYSNDELFIMSAAQPMITQWGRGGGGVMGNNQN